MSINGILVVDKSEGMTSHDVVGKVRRAAGIKRVGHTGTLDPDATGVLVICLGPATRMAEYFVDRGKRYSAVCKLGITTATEDASGEVLTRLSAAHVSEDDVRSILPQFVGEIQQIPPMVSAVHHNGQRLYELARAGEVVEREPRAIHIDSIALNNFIPGVAATFELEVECGKGAYIRTLCADIGAALGVGAHMASLRRTSVGPFLADDALKMQDLTRESILARLIPAAEAMPWFPAVSLTDAELDDIFKGRAIERTGTDADVVRLISHTGELAALAALMSGRLHPFKVFPQENA
jgi:tRNA pseudouridine55 synthase